MTFRIAYIGMMTFLWLLTGPAEGLAQGKRSLDDVLTAWRAREKSMRSLRVVSTGVQMFSKSTFAASSGGLRGGPKDDVRFEQTQTFMLDGDKMWYECKGSIWSEKRGELVPDHTIHTFDGVRSLQFSPAIASSWPTAVIYPQDFNVEIKNAHTLPLRALYRPFHKKMGVFEPSRMKIVTHDALVNERPCMILEEAVAKGRKIRRVWVDPQRSFSILRYTIGTVANTELQADIEYALTSDEAWLPSEWSTSFYFGDAVLMECYAGKVIECELNPRLASDAFTITFPNGTLVTDLTARSQLGNYSEFIVRKGGATRPILRSDVGATYQQLLNSEPGAARSAGTGRVSVRWIVLLAVAALCAVFVYRKYSAYRAS